MILCNLLKDSPCCTFGCTRNVIVHMSSLLWRLRAAAVDWTSAVGHPALQHSSFSFCLSFLSSDVWAFDVFVILLYMIIYAFLLCRLSCPMGQACRILRIRFRWWHPCSLLRNVAQASSQVWVWPGLDE